MMMKAGPSLGLFSCQKIFFCYYGVMPKEEFSLRPQETPKNNDEEGYNPTPEDEKMILEMQGEKGVKRVITPGDRWREEKAAKAALKVVRRKILGETKTGQQEISQVK